MRLRLVDAVLDPDLGDELVLALERAEFLLRKFAPLGADLLERDLLGVNAAAGARRAGIRVYGVHARYLQSIDEKSFECASLKQ